MRNTESDLLKLLSESLFGCKSDVEISDEIMKEARIQTVSSLISSSEFGMLATNMLVAAAHADLTKVLEGIPFVTIKGFASAYYYSNPVKRDMGDVDIFVDTKHFDETVEALRKNGFREANNHHERHITFERSDVVFEVHHTLKGFPGDVTKERYDAELKEAYEQFVGDLISTRRRIHVQRGDVIIPDDYHHGVIMLMHVAGHLLESGGIGLRHLCDWAVYADKVPLDQYRAGFEALGLWKFACQLTALSTRYLGLREMPWAGRWDESFLEEFMEDILEAGNFGTKNSGRILSVQMANADHFYEPFIAKVRKKFRFCERHGWLLPVGTILYVFGYLGSQFRRGRSINLSFVNEGRKRKALYDQFGLYQLEDER
ncbi:MAG: nucleotidyltransferase family protein [Lachnospiraceae bacterium]|nr:nucleotidyltransferase family protein [Lachnospiraceae bacterium]